MESARLLLAKSRTVRNAGWMLAGQGTGLLLQAVYFVFLGRLLGSVEYGIFAGAYAFTSLLAPYSSLGSGTVFMRYSMGKAENFAPYFGNILASTLLFSGLLVAALTLSAPHLISPASAHLVLLAAVANCLFAQLTVEVGRVFQSYESMRTTAIVNLLVNALRTIAVIVLLEGWHHVSAYQWAAWSTGVSAFAACVGVGLLIHRFGRPTVVPSLVRRHVAEGLGFSFAASTSSVYNDLDKSMLSHYNMNEQNGLYSVAYRIIDFATMPLFAVRDATIPRMFREAHSDAAKAVRYGLHLMPKALLLGVVGTIAILLGAPLLPVLVGPSFQGSVEALRWLAVLPILRSVHQISGSVLTVTGCQWARTVAQVCCAMLNFGLNLRLIPHFGWRGAAWSSVATDGALAVFNVLLVGTLFNKHLGIQDTRWANDSSTPRVSQTPLLVLPIYVPRDKEDSD